MSSFGSVRTRRPLLESLYSAFVQNEARDLRILVERSRSLD